MEQLVRDGAWADLEMSCERSPAFKVLLLRQVTQPETAPAHHQSTMGFLLAGIDRVHPSVDLDARSVVPAIEPVPPEAIQQCHELVTQAPPLQLGPVLVPVLRKELASVQRLGPAVRTDRRIDLTALLQVLGCPEMVREGLEIDPRLEVRIQEVRVVAEENDGGVVDSPRASGGVRGRPR